MHPRAFSYMVPLTVYCLNGANAPRYRGCLPATSYDIEAIKMIGSVELSSQITCIFLPSDHPKSAVRR